MEARPYTTFMTKGIVVLTGDEYRHRYFRMSLAKDPRFRVLGSVCEGTQKSLATTTANNPNATPLERQHVEARTQAEHDFFDGFVEGMEDRSQPYRVVKGAINDIEVIEHILGLQPDLLVCYGSSLIKGQLLEQFEGRFLNVHLGLSPYYRGSGTNIWPMINDELDMIGATFMHIDAGIDTGRIIHQIRAEILLGDSPHSIGNRLIRKMTGVYADLIANFDRLHDEKQPQSEGRLYKIRDYDARACEAMYANLESGAIKRYLDRRDHANLPYIVENQALEKLQCAS